MRKPPRLSQSLRSSLKLGEPLLKELKLELHNQGSFKDLDEMRGRLFILSSKLIEVLPSTSFLRNFANLGLYGDPNFEKIQHLLTESMKLQ